MKNRESSGVSQVDVAIIGAGTAGLSAYRAARSAGARVVLIESGPYGTTCARVGCMPSKLLISSAEAKHAIDHASLFGIEDASGQVNGKAVMERVRRERDRFAGFVVESVDQFPAEDKIRGHARFVDNQTLHIALEDGGEQILRADRMVIATGSRPSYPPHFRELGDRLLTSDDVFELAEIPKRLAVFGPGVIGLELGQAFSRLGAEVSVFGIGGGLGAIRDDEIRAYAKKTFAEEFYLDTDAKVHALQRREADGKVWAEIRFDHIEKGEVTEAFDYVIAATGRTPNVDQLGLENTTLARNERGIPLFDRYTMQCGDHPIFITGDADNDAPLLHEAADEGRIAGKNAANYPQVRAGLRRTPLAIVFTDPQIATVGLTLDQVKARCQQCYATGVVSFEDQGRSRVMGKNKGLMKVYGEQGTGLFLGAEIFGPAAEHLAHLLAWAAQQRMTVSDMLSMPFYHPVIEEGLRTALRDLNHKLHIGPETIERCLDCGPGA